MVKFAVLSVRKCLWTRLVLCFTRNKNDDIEHWLESDDKQLTTVVDGVVDSKEEVEDDDIFYFKEDEEEDNVVDFEKDKDEKKKRVTKDMHELLI